MNTRPSEGLQLINEIKKGLSASMPSGVLVLACTPYTHLQSAVAQSAGSALAIGAQSMHFKAAGAYTGEISADMLKDLGVAYVIIGHSERRQYFAESNESCNLKLKTALENNLVPLYCIGETLDEREADQHFSIVEKQLAEGLQGIEPTGSEQLIIAYEPVWAIGTGKTASPEQAAEMHGFIRHWLGKRYASGIAADISILYGGSMNAANAAGLLAKTDIDGGLIGGASLKPAEFLSIVNDALGIANNR